jgi:hypothetical protein
MEYKDLQSAIKGLQILLLPTIGLQIQSNGKSNRTDRKQKDA